MSTRPVGETERSIDHEAPAISGLSNRPAGARAVASERDGEPGGAMEGDIDGRMESEVDGEAERESGGATEHAMDSEPGGAMEGEPDDAMDIESLFGSGRTELRKLFSIGC